MNISASQTGRPAGRPAAGRSGGVTGRGGGRPWCEEAAAAVGGERVVVSTVARERRVLELRMQPQKLHLRFGRDERRAERRVERWSREG